MIRPRRFDPLAAACVVFVAALVVVFAVLVRRESRPAGPFGEKIIASAPSSVGYREQAAAIVENFLETKAALPTAAVTVDLQTALSAARGDLLALTVPSAERSLHLRLVGALTEWEEGIKTGNQILADTGSGAFSELLDEFPWLGEGLLNR